MNFREYLWVGVRPFAGKFNPAVRDGVAAALQNKHDIVSRAAARAAKHHFHGTRGRVVAAAVGGAVHGGHMPAACLRDKQHTVRSAPVDCAFHYVSSIWSLAHNDSEAGR